MFWRLAVFIGDWTLEGAEAVCAEDDPAGRLQAGQRSGTPAVMDLLLRLVDKSLVVPHEQGGQTRYRMLETIRQFAHERLSESGEDDPLRARHLEFFLTFSESAESLLRGPESSVWLNQLGAEYENLRAALEWACDTGSPQPAARLARAIEQLADVQILFGVATKAIPLYSEALKLWQGAEGADPAIVARLHGKILQTVGRLHMRVDSRAI